MLDGLPQVRAPLSVIPGGIQEASGGFRAPSARSGALSVIPAQAGIQAN